MEGELRKDVVDRLGALDRLRELREERVGTLVQLPHPLAQVLIRMRALGIRKQNARRADRPELGLP